MSVDNRKSLTVLGIGNILMRDEAIGVRVMEAARDARDWPGGVEFVDGGAGGLNLLNVIEGAERLVVFDAGDMGLEPGEFRVIAPDQVCADTEHRVSMHDVPFLETLELCGEFFHRPRRVSILAIQPGDVDYGRGLTDELAAAFDRIVAAAVGLIERELDESS